MGRNAQRRKAKKEDERLARRGASGSIALKDKRLAERLRIRGPVEQAGGRA